MRGIIALGKIPVLRIDANPRLDIRDLDQLIKAFRKPAKG